MKRSDELAATDELLELIREEDASVAQPHEHQPDLFSLAEDEPAAMAAALPAALPPASPPPKSGGPGAAKFSRFGKGGSSNKFQAAIAGVFRRKDEVLVGISLDRLGVEVVVVGRAGGSPAISGYSVSPWDEAPAAGFAEQWLQSPGVRACLRRALAEAGVAKGGGKSTRIRLALPFDQVEVHNLSVPKGASGVLAGAVFFAARRNIAEYDPQTQILDFIPVGNSEEDGRIRVLVLLAPRKLVDCLERVFREISFPLAGITTPFAAIRSLAVGGVLEAEEEVPFSLLRLEEDHSFISLFSGQNLRFSREIKTGLNSILLADSHSAAPSPAAPPAPPQPEPPELELEAEAKPLALQDEQAALILSLEDDNRDDHQESLDSQPPSEPSEPPESPEQSGGPEVDQLALNRLVRQLERTFDYCRTNLGLARPSRLYISGTGDFGRGLRTLIEEDLGIDCGWLDPFAVLSATGCRPPKDVQRRQLLAVAAGLALGNDRGEQNFLETRADREKRQLAFRLNQVIIAGCSVVALVLTGLYLWQLTIASDLRRDLDQVQKQPQMEAHQVEEGQLLQLAAELKGLRDQIESRAQRLRPLGLLTALPQLIPPQQVRLVEFKLLSGKRGEGSETVTVGGVIAGNAAARELSLRMVLRNLIQSPLVKEAVVRQRREFQGDEGELLYFLIELEAASLRLAEQPGKSERN